MGERLACTEEAAGSSPAGSIHHEGERSGAPSPRQGISTNENNGAHSNGAATKPREWFVHSLLQSSVQIQLILQHMLRFDIDTGNRSDVGIPEVLQELISGTLEHELDRDPEEYAAAAVLLADVRKAIEENMYVVGPGAFEDEWPPDEDAEAA